MFARRGGVVRRRPLLRAAVVGGRRLRGWPVLGPALGGDRRPEADQEAQSSDLEQSQQAPAPAPSASQEPQDAFHDGPAVRAGPDA